MAMAPLQLQGILLLLLFVLHLQPFKFVGGNPISLGSSLSPLPGENSWKSPSELFAFGYYRQRRGLAVGIWLSGSEENTVVWTAHRDDGPASYRSTINFTTDGKVVLLEGGETKAIAEAETPAASAAMLDSGNFVVYDDKLKVIWQSFDHPTDILLGGQKLRVKQMLVSSAADSDHSSGRFCLILQGDENLVAYPLNMTHKTAATAYWASDTYVYRGSTGRADVFLYLKKAGSLIIGHPNDTVKELFSSPSNGSVIYRVTLGFDGNLVLYSHRYRFGIKEVVEEWSALNMRDSPCENKAYCGFNSYCNAAGNCSCFPGFVHHSVSADCYPEFLDDGGCAAINDSTLRVSHNMTLLKNISWQSSPYAVIKLDSINYCSQICLQDCNCWGVLFDNTTGICRKYKLPLMFASLDMYSSVTALVKSSSPIQTNSTSTSTSNTSNSVLVVVIERRPRILVLSIGLSLGLFAALCSILAILSFFYYRGRVRRYQVLPPATINGDHLSLRSFSYPELERATDGFKGPGPLYKGSLANKTVAVKALENVTEGDTRFRTEMTAVGRTHHRNLVQLLGFCIHGSRKLLVYEFMSNGSLADLLFGPGRTRPTWSVRVRIALDVARGILYLHEECETRIIHCNINPHNILLNDTWTAKISDFGLAKLLTSNQSGTYTGAKGKTGYVAPEWQKSSLITEKADVYSFGAVLLEIIFCRNLEEVGFDKIEFEQMMGMEEVEMKVGERMVKVGLLCMQEDANMRPSMNDVIMMLEGTINIPTPHLMNPPALSLI